jgi:hypothetical protein
MAVVWRLLRSTLTSTVGTPAMFTVVKSVIANFGNLREYRSSRPALWSGMSFTYCYKACAVIDFGIFEK